MCNMRPGLCVCETPAEMDEESDLYEVDEEVESGEEDRAADGEGERRRKWSGKERTGEWRATESGSSQEEEAPGQRQRREKERKKKEKERGEIPGKELAAKDVECKDGEGETAKSDGESHDGDKMKRRGERPQTERGGGKEEVPESHSKADDEGMDTSEGQRVQKKRKKKEKVERNAERSCGDIKRSRADEGDGEMWKSSGSVGSATLQATINAWDNNVQLRGGPFPWFSNTDSHIMEIIMNISYANYFPSAFLLLSRDACPEKNGVRQVQFCVQPLTGISDAPTPVIRRLNACDETTQRL
ncbi:hypothetical protein F2P79_019771 [Pimephales promelas]|nr:hypothetical protein F2P79_019771 [Pimephales promelas]